MNILLPTLAKPRSWTTLAALGATACLLAASWAGDDPPPRLDAAAWSEHPSDPTFTSGLIGSPHDFTTQGAEPRDLCLPCHTPHLTRARPPRLDQRPAAREGLPTFRSGSVELSNASLMCLSCHDGIIAPDVYSRAHSAALADQLGSQSLGTSPLTSHPLGIRYPVNNPRFHPAQAVTADGRIKLPDGRLQCTTCHDPHNRGGYAGLLVKSNRRSALCLSCHRL